MGLLAALLYLLEDRRICFISVLSTYDETIDKYEEKKVLSLAFVENKRMNSKTKCKITFGGKNVNVRVKMFIKKNLFCVSSIVIS